MTRYEQGFLSKCAEYGIDGKELLKQAQMPSWLGESASKARAGELEWMREAAKNAKPLASAVPAAGAGTGATAAAAGAVPALAAPTAALAAGTAGVAIGNALNKHVPVTLANGKTYPLGRITRTIGSLPRGTDDSGVPMAPRMLGRAGRYVGEKLVPVRDRLDTAITDFKNARVLAAAKARAASGKPRLRALQGEW